MGEAEISNIGGKIIDKYRLACKMKSNLVTDQSDYKEEVALTTPALPPVRLAKFREII